MIGMNLLIVDDALDFLKTNTGSHFDPECISALYGAFSVKRFSFKCSQFPSLCSIEGTIPPPRP
jgi:hypothetical protein